MLTLKVKDNTRHNGEEKEEVDSRRGEKMILTKDRDVASTTKAVISCMVRTVYCIVNSSNYKTFVETLVSLLVMVKPDGLCN